MLMAARYAVLVGGSSWKAGMTTWVLGAGRSLMLRMAETL